MRYFPLVWAAVWRKPVEAVLIWLAVTAAFTLFGLMVGLHATYEHMIESARLDRLYVDSRFPAASATGILLPFAVGNEIARVEGVSAVAPLVILPGYYQNPRRGARIMAVDEHMRAAWPELPLTPVQWDQLMATPTGIFMSRSAAARLGLKAGDTLPLITSPGTRTDGAPAWEFHVLGVVADRADGSPIILGNLNYLDRSGPKNLQGYAWEFRVAIRDGTQANQVAVQIDRRLANSATPTLTIPNRVSMIDAVNSGISVASKTWPVAGAGIFMILLLTANGVAQSVRERTSEFAVLKTVGYRDPTLMALVLAEVAVPCVAGAVLGTGVAKLLMRLPVSSLPSALWDLPKPTLSSTVLAAAVGCSLALALASAVVPMRRVCFLSVTDALAGR